MGRHNRPYEDPYQTRDQFEQEVAEMDAIEAMDEDRPVSAGRNPRELNDWIAGYVQGAHPGIYREALHARGDEIVRVAERRKAREQEQDASTDSVWASYADAFRTSEARARMREAMTGDDLITLVTSAPTEEEAVATVLNASARARTEAADTLHIDTAHHGNMWTSQAITREARA